VKYIQKHNENERETRLFVFVVFFNAKVKKSRKSRPFSKKMFFLLLFVFLNAKINNNNY
jgi:hypothetical protein